MENAETKCVSKNVMIPTVRVTCAGAFDCIFHFCGNYRVIKENRVQENFRHINYSGSYPYLKILYLASTCDGSFPRQGTASRSFLNACCSI